MKRLLLAVTSLLAAFVSPTRTADPTHPNVIFILADDLGIGDVSCYGGDHFPTPNIDALAKVGTRYTHCYAAPLCGPSRALIMTGRYAFRTGMTGNASGDLIKPQNEVMMPTIMRSAGYATAQCGKWSQLPLDPQDFGFQQALRFKGSGDYWNTQQRAKVYKVDGKETPLADGEYLPDKMHDYVVKFITEHQKDRFYLYYPLSHIHVDILPTPDSPKDSKDLYGDNVKYMDKLVGKLMDKLDELKLRDDTLVIFVGDNGTAKMFAERSTVQGRPLSGCKGTMLEGGSLVPMIAVWPGHTPAGKTSDQLLDFSDYLPTLAEIVGAKLPEGVTIDGQSFATQLQGKEGKQRDWAFVELGRHWYARSMNYKLDEAGQLFDMSKAPFEEPLVPADSTAEKAVSARTELAAVLAKLAPEKGKLDPNDGSGRRLAAQRRNAVPADAAPAAPATDAKGNRAATFDSFDTDKTGKLTKEQFLERRKIPNAAKRFDIMDTNHDGVLTKEEFIANGAGAASAAK